MAEGGQFPWKRQTIDASRGPTADYSSLSKPLPSPPKGVEWKYDAPTKEWRLVRSDTDDDKRKYDLNITTTWNPHVGRVQPSIVPVPKQEQDDDDDLLLTPEKASNHEEDHPKDAVENVDYVVHTVLPSDTLPGLCLRYKTKPTILRQVNKFSGSNLLLAPSKLIIPLNEDTDIATIKIQDKTCPEFKLHALVAEFPHLRQTEAKAYLTMNDWDLELAIQSVHDDEMWELEQEKKLQKKKVKPLLTVHVAVPADDAVKDHVAAVKSSKEQEDKGLMEPLLLKELELSPRRMC